MHENRESPEIVPPSGPVGKGLWRMTPTPPSPRGAATGRSDIGIVPVNPPNNAHQPAAEAGEAGEGRPVTEENSNPLTASQAQDWTDASYKLEWVRAANGWASTRGRSRME